MMDQTDILDAAPAADKESFKIDPTACEAYGFCFEVAPSVFDSDDWGYAKVIATGLLAGPELERAREAFRLCPVKAIKNITK